MHQNTARWPPPPPPALQPLDGIRAAPLPPRPGPVDKPFPSVDWGGGLLLTPLPAEPPVHPHQGAFLPLLPVWEDLLLPLQAGTAPAVPP